MDYLSKHYKNQCEQLSIKKLQLENQVKVLRFKTFLIEKDGGMFTKSTNTNQSGGLVSYTPQTQADLGDLWRWIFGPGNPTPGPGVSPGTPGGRSPGTPTPGPGRPRDGTRPWTPNEKYRGRESRPVEGNPPRAYPGTQVPPGPPTGVPPAKKYGNPPRDVGDNPRPSLFDGKYYYLAQDGSVYRWSVSEGQWIRVSGNTPFGPTRGGGFIPGAE